MSTLWRATPLVASAGLVLSSGEAQAHLVSTGLGPVYDGVAHFVLSPEDLVPVIGLAILTGLRGPAHGRWALFVLPTFWLLGGICGEVLGTPSSDVLTAMSLLVVGGLVVVDLPLPLWTTTTLAALIGAAHGFADGSTIPFDGTRIRILLGITGAVFAAFALMVMLVLPLQSRVARTAMRVFGSWIGAAGLLLFGWWLRSGPVLSENHIRTYW